MANMLKLAKTQQNWLKLAKTDLRRMARIFCLGLSSLCAWFQQVLASSSLVLTSFRAEVWPLLILSFSKFQYLVLASFSHFKPVSATGFSSIGSSTWFQPVLVLVLTSFNNGFQLPGFSQFQPVLKVLVSFSQFQRIPPFLFSC